MPTSALERERIALQIKAVVGPYRIEQERSDPEACEKYRGRARDLLDSLDGAVGPFPDLQEALRAARAELGLDRWRGAERRSTA